MEDIRKGVCPLCKHNEVLETEPSDLGDQNVSYPMAAARIPLIRRFLGLSYKDGESLVGTLRTFICRRCGFTQWFTVKPEDIPIAPGNGVRLLTTEPVRPYR